MNTMFILGLNVGFLLGLITMVLDRRYMSWIRNKFSKITPEDILEEINLAEKAMKEYNKKFDEIAFRKN